MKRSYGLVLGFFAVALVSVGCAQLIGLEERPVESSGTGGKDSGSGGGGGEGPVTAFGHETTQLCVDYCRAVEENCTGEFRQYAREELCILTCNHLPEGDVEGSGNTVTCRASQADSAKAIPAEHCPNAGPGGGDTCGSNCEAYCQLLESVCPDKYALLDGCQTSCAGLDDDGNKVVIDGANLQCRLYHVGAAAGTPAENMTHCAHAEYNPKIYPTDHCLEDPDSLVPCGKICKVLMANCPASDGAVYDSQRECEAACQVFDEGVIAGGPADGKSNTRGCRFYHSRLAGEDRNPHCAHAGPSGASVCQVDEVADDGTLLSSQNCDSYCRLYKKGCADDFADRYADDEACRQACVTDYSSLGARGNDKLPAGATYFYSVKTAPLSDTLQCRIYRSVKAVAALAADKADDAKDACALAALDGDCADE
jgi:hypothetical protein